VAATITRHYRSGSTTWFAAIGLRYLYTTRLLGRKPGSYT